MCNLIKKNQKGFTIFEFLVSVAIIGTISSLFIVNVSKETRGNELNEAVILLNDQIRELQNLALSSSQHDSNNVMSWGMYLEEGESTAIIFTDNDDVSGIPGDTIYQAGECVKDLVFPSNITFGEDGNSNFKGWDLDGEAFEDRSVVDHLFLFFYPPDSRVEISIRQQENNPGHQHSYRVSYVEFDLYNSDTVETVKVRINNYGLLEVID